MADIQLINLGTAPGAGNGENLRSGGAKINASLTALNNALVASQTDIQDLQTTAANHEGAILQLTEDVDGKVDISNKATSADIESGTPDKWVDAEGLVQYMSDRFAIIYPNGGSAASPANITINTRYVVSNPFPGRHVICQLELYDKGEWSIVSFTQLPTVGGIGAVAAQFGDSDNIVIQTGSNSLFGSAAGTGNLFTSPTSATTSAPCRIKVWR